MKSSNSAWLPGRGRAVFAGLLRIFRSLVTSYRLFIGSSTVTAPPPESPFGGGSSEFSRVIAIWVLSSRVDNLVGLVVLAGVTVRAVGIGGFRVPRKTCEGLFSSTNASRVCRIRLISCLMESILCLCDKLISAFAWH